MNAMDFSKIPVGTKLKWQQADGQPCAGFVTGIDSNYIFIKAHGGRRFVLRIKDFSGSVPSVSSMPSVLNPEESANPTLSPAP